MPHLDPAFPPMSLRRSPRRLSWGLALFAGLLVQGAFAQESPTFRKIRENGVITLGYRESSMPFSYYDDQHQPVGYSVDICLRLVEAMRQQWRRPIEVRFVPVTAANRLEAVAKGEVDLECGTTTSNAERRKAVAFTVPTYIATTSFLVRRGSGITSAADLAGKVVATTQGTTAARIFHEIDEMRGLRARLVEAKDHDQAFEQLQSGRADAFIMDDVLLYSLRAASGTPEKFEVTRDRLNIEPLAIMLRKDDPGFKQWVDKEISHLIVDGEMARLYARWFESPIPPKNLNLHLPMSYLLRDSFRSPTDWLPN